MIPTWTDLETPVDSGVLQHGKEAYWVNDFEVLIGEVGWRAAVWEVDENDGGNRADIMLAEILGGGS